MDIPKENRRNSIICFSTTSEVKKELKKLAKKYKISMSYLIHVILVKRLEDENKQHD